MTKLFWFIIVLLCLLVIVSSSGVTYYKNYPEEHPVVNLPLSLRQENYTEGGSCVWATTISLLRWQGQYELADWIRKARSGGVFTSELFDTIDKAGLKFSSTNNGDVSFLEWACQTRRGAAIVINGGAHMVTLVDMDEYRVCILDNNSIEQYKWLSRTVVLKEWKQSGGIAFTPVYSPASPLP